MNLVKSWFSKLLINDDRKLAKIYLFTLLRKFWIYHDFKEINKSRAVSRKNLIWPFFYVKMRKNGFFFRNLHEKLGKKMLRKNFFLVIWRSNMGSKMDPYKNRPFHYKWSKIVNFECFSSGKCPKWWKLDSLHDFDKIEFLTLWPSEQGCIWSSNNTSTLGFSSAQKPLNHIMIHTFLSWGRLVLPLTWIKWVRFALLIFILLVKVWHFYKLESRFFLEISLYFTPNWLIFIQNS